MDKFLFISRHEPTARQRELAAEQDVELIHVGDLDAFDPDLGSKIEGLEIEHVADEDSPAVGVVAVHGLICAVAARHSYKLGFFRNVNRAPVGEKPDFDTDLFVVFDI